MLELNLSQNTNSTLQANGYNPNGTLMYIAQAFLLAGSIFGLNYYVNKLSILYGKDKDNSPRNPQQ